MALVISSSLRNKPSMLKDYLLDDFGSCSSSGFRSFPRKQRCVEIRGSRSTASKISCAIRKASTAIIRLLPMPKKSLLPRSISKGIGKRRLLKKTDEIERWISCGKADLKKHQPLDLSTTVTITSASSSSSIGDSWSESDSEFTLTCSSFDENGVVRGKRKGCGDESTQPTMTKNDWSDEEKENSSPVSVLNYPEDDGDQETGSSSPFTRRLNHLEGTKEKLMQKLRRFESLSRIDPTNIESLLSITDYSDDDSSPSPQQNSLYEDIETEDMAAERLLDIIKTKMCVNDAYNFDTDNLLVNFFLDGLVKGRKKNLEVVEETLVKEAEDWVLGIGHDKAAVGWKVKEKRKVYAKDMEDVVWRSDDVDKDEVIVQTEAHVFASLVDEMVEELMAL